MSHADIANLRTRAQAGDPEALTRLGWRLLTGAGMAASPQEGVSCIEAAASRGEAEANAILALCEAWAVLRPRNVEAALDRLRQAAALGWAPAQRELRFLARGEGDDWAALRTQVDVARWTSAPAVRTVSVAPRIRACTGLATAEECAWLIELARRGLHRALIYRKDAAGYTDSENRTNSEADYTIDRADVVLNLLRTRLATAVGVESRFFEIAKLLRYEPGQTFGPHCDFQEPATPALREEVERHGQRVATLLLYLNDDYEGGETEFTRIGLRYKAAIGDALLFDNVKPDGALDYDTLHAGLPPTRGIKWLYSQWIRSRPVGPA